MTPSTADASPENPPQSHRLRFELIVGSVLLAFGLFALPGLVFLVGSSLLGPYGKDAGVGTFYADFFGDLASGSVRAWTLAVGPLVLVGLVRLLFLGPRNEPTATDNQDVASPQPRSRTGQESRRVEPRVSLD